MATRGTADLVVCIDASGSMTPCFDAVRQHVNDFIAGLGADAQRTWELRFDFVAYSVLERGGRPAYRHASVFHDDLWGALYGKATQAARLFTPRVSEFQDDLGRIRVGGDEASLTALDFALDFPWREASACHRVVILLTDEAFETGHDPAGQSRPLPALIDKIQALRVMLYLVTPSSPVYEQLSEVDRCEHWPAGDRGDGLASVDLGEVMRFVGQSVSASTAQRQTMTAPRGLFGQASWSPADVA